MELFCTYPYGIKLIHPCSPVEKKSKETTAQLCKMTDYICETNFIFQLQNCTSQFVSFLRHSFI